MEIVEDDYKTIWASIKEEERELISKRRWLMGLPLTSKNSGKKCLISPKFLEDLFLPESLIREDDVSYENVSNSVRKGFAASIDRRESDVVQDYIYLFDPNRSVSMIRKVLPNVLDDMNNTGLCHLANLVTGNLVVFDKTRWRIKKVIREHLPKILRKPDHEYHIILMTQLPVLLKNPNNFLENRVTVSSMDKSYHSAATELLEKLQYMPFQSLNAMHRKLKGLQVDYPTLKPPKSGWTHSRLTEKVSKTCREMLSKVDSEGELPEPLAKAMAVATLSLKLITETHHISMPEFCFCSPRTLALQNEILIAIWALNEMKIKDTVIKELQGLLDPNATVLGQHFRGSVRRMLTDCLFECSDMDIIPKILQETLGIINKSSPCTSTLCFSEEEIEKEVDCVLNLSSQIRQIAWNLYEGHDIGKEFSDAYMEDLEESDDDDQRLEARSLQVSGACCSDEVESVGEWRPVDSACDTNDDGSSVPLIPDCYFSSNCVEESQQKPMGDQVMSDPHESSFHDEAQHISGNQYLAIQEICDETSLVAHQIIGRLMEGLLVREGIDLNHSKKSYLRSGVPSRDDAQASRDTQTCSREDNKGPLLVRVVEELLPSFPKSGMERLKEFIELK